MRIRTVLVWFVVAGVLALLVAISRSGSNRPDRAATQGEPWAIPLDLARVDRLVLTAGGVERFAIERTRQTADRWVLTWANDAATASWPAQAERVRAAIRLLASTPVITTGDEAEAASPTATLSVHEADGRSVEIGFGDRTVGGQIPVIVDVRDEQNIARRRVLGRLPADSFDAFVRTPWTAWRDNGIFDAGTASAASVVIQAGSHRVRLQRGSQGWAITDPYPLDADDEEVGRALGVIASLTATEFVDGAVPDNATGLSDPIATISVDSGQGTRVLELGRPGAADAAALFARVSTGPDRQVIRIDSESVARLTAVPEAYARRTPLGISAADVARVRFIATNGTIPFEARRRAGDWTIGGVPATPDERDAINRLLTVTTLEPAARVAVIPADSETGKSLGEVRFLTEEGLPLGALRLTMGEDLRLALARPLNDVNSIEWTSVSEKAKGVALWASAVSSMPDQ
ncbi:MAG: DUF4340 domain-containing protein [Planctomycetota bacterium]